MGAHDRWVVTFVIVAASAGVACGGDEGPGGSGTGASGGEAGHEVRGGSAGTGEGASGAMTPGSGGEAGREQGSGGASGATMAGAAGESGAGEGGTPAASGGEAGAGAPPDPSGGAGGEGGATSPPERDPRCDEGSETALLGTGAESDPYLVCNAAQLALLGTGDYTLELAYALGDDLDVSDPAFTTLGDASTPLTGTFDGRGHAVRGLGAALFAGIEDGAVVRELSLSGEADATLEPIRWGFLAWENRGLVQRVHVDATLAAPSHSGLLLGLNQGTVEGCSSAGEISGDAAHVGGLVGVNEGVVRRSFSTATVTATQRVGGLVGRQ